MNVHARFVMGALAALPISPLLVVHGRRVRATVPSLPEARDPEGEVGRGRPFRLLTLGESTVAGVGVQRHADGITGQLAVRLAETLEARVRWSAVARNGVTAADVRRDLLPMVPDDPPDLVVVGLGANDTFQARPTWHWQEHTDGLLRDLRGRFGPVPVVFAHMPPIRHFPAFTPALRTVLGGLVDLHARALDEVVARHERAWFVAEPIEAEQWIRRSGGVDDPDAFFSDGVHPSQLAYRCWAHELVDFMDRVGVPLSRG